jgi:c-di-AMP phosphodiesterase-like protein
MIITLIFVALLIIAIICSNIKWAEFIAIISFIFSIVGIIFISGFIIAININRDIDYQNKLYEREMLEYRIEKMEENITGNEMLYNDIVAFNNGLRETKRWANSPWTNWFFNKDIATIDYIEIT